MLPTSNTKNKNPGLADAPRLTKLLCSIRLKDLSVLTVSKRTSAATRPVMVKTWHALPRSQNAFRLRYRERLLSRQAWFFAGVCSTLNDLEKFNAIHFGADHCDHQAWLDDRVDLHIKGFEHFQHAKQKRCHVRSSYGAARDLSSLSQGSGARVIGVGNCRPMTTACHLPTAVLSSSSN